MEMLYLEIGTIACRYSVVVIDGGDYLVIIN